MRSKYYILAEDWMFDSGDWPENQDIHEWQIEAIAKLLRKVSTTKQVT